MKISTNAIVSNSEMIKSYKACREKAEGCGKIFILKNNQPDAVLISATEYEKLSAFIEYIDMLDEQELAAMFAALPVERVKKPVV
ncbi:MAG: type II toxin-antitoxin system prevent-host-death family antitoxin [Clostridiaceae bacterium]